MMNIACGLVASLIRVGMGLRNRVKMLMYKQLIRPVLFYVINVDEHVNFSNRVSVISSSSTSTTRQHHIGNLLQ